MKKMDATWTFHVQVGKKEKEDGMRKLSRDVRSGFWFLIGFALITGLVLVSGCGSEPDRVIDLSLKGEEVDQITIGEIRQDRIFPEEALCHSQFSVRAFSYRIVGNGVEKVGESSFTADSEEMKLIFHKQNFLISPSVDGIAYLVIDDTNEAGCGFVEFMGWFEEGLRKPQDRILRFDGGYSVWRNPDYFSRGKEAGNALKAKALRSALSVE